MKNVEINTKKKTQNETTIHLQFRANVTNLINYNSQFINYKQLFADKVCFFFHLSCCCCCSAAFCSIAAMISILPCISHKHKRQLVFVQRANTKANAKCSPSQCLTLTEILIYNIFWERPHNSNICLFRALARKKK